MGDLRVGNGHVLRRNGITYRVVTVVTSRRPKLRIMNPASVRKCVDRCTPFFACHCFASSEGRGGAIGRKSCKEQCVVRSFIDGAVKSTSIMHHAFALLAILDALHCCAIDNFT